MTHNYISHPGQSVDSLIKPQFDVKLVVNYVFLSVAQRPLVGQELLIIEVSRSRSRSDTPHSVGVLWTGYQPDAGTSASQYTTLKTDRHPCPRWESNPQSQQTSDRRPIP